MLKFFRSDNINHKRPKRYWTLNGLSEKELLVYFDKIINGDENII